MTNMTIEPITGEAIVLTVRRAADTTDTDELCLWISNDEHAYALLSRATARMARRGRRWTARWAGAAVREMYGRRLPGGMAYRRIDMSAVADFFNETLSAADGETAQTIEYWQ